MLSRNQIIALSYAKIGNQVKLLELIKQDKELLNLRDENNNTLLLISLKCGHLELSQNLVEAGASINVSNAKKMTPLLYVIKKQFYDFARFLIIKSNGLTVNDLNSKKISALMMVCQSGDIETAKCLLANHASLYDKNHQGMDSFMIASLYQNTQICQLLLDKGADINSIDYHGETALHKAVILDDELMMDFLLKNKASTLIKNKDNETVLDLCAKQANIEKVELFLSIQNKSVESLFFWAIEEGHIALLKALLVENSVIQNQDHSPISDDLIASQVQIFEEGNQEDNSLAYATVVSNEVSAQLIHQDQHLVTASAPLLSDAHVIPFIDQKNKNGDTPLIYAVKKNQIDVVKCLIENGASVELVDSHGDNAINLAFGSSKLKCAEVFYRHIRQQGKSFNRREFNLAGKKIFDQLLKSFYIENPLIIATKNKNHEDALDLLKNGAEVNDIDRYGNSALIWAVHNGDLTLMTYLINYGADLNHNDDSGWTPLMHAAFKNHYECIEKLLINFNSSLLIAQNNKGDSALNIALKGNNKQSIYFLYKAMKYLGLTTPKNNWLHDLEQEHEFEIGLMSAVNHNNTSLVDSLLSKGAVISCQDKSGLTSLMLSCQNGNLSMMKYLIDKGASLNDVDFKGRQLIHVASLFDRKDIIAYLLNLNVNINSYVNEAGELYKMQAIHCAVASKSIHVLNYLISQNKFLVREKNNRDETPLHLAALNNDIETSRILVESGALLEATDYRGRTPIEVALNKSFVGSAKFLYIEMRSKGISLPKITTEKQRQVLEKIEQEALVENLLILSVKQNNLEDVKKHLHSGSNVDAKDHDNNTALMVALANRNFDIADLLFHHGANMDVLNIKNETPLMQAAFHGDIEMINYLLMHSADIIKRNSSGFNALMYAVDGDQLEAINFLLNNNMTLIDHKNHEGWTALSLAIMQRKTSIVACLMQHGASQNIKNRSGQTLLMTLCANGDLELVKQRLVQGDDITITDPSNNTALNYAVNNGKIELVKLLVIFMINRKIKFSRKDEIVKKIESDVGNFKQYCLSKYQQKPTFEFINCYSQVSMQNSSLDELDRLEIFNNITRRLDRILSLESSVVSQLNQELSYLGFESKVSINILSELEHIMHELELSSSEVTNELIEIKLMQDIRSSNSNLKKAIKTKDNNGFFSSSSSRKRSDSLKKSVETSAIIALGRASEVDNAFTRVALTGGGNEAQTDIVKIQRLVHQLKLDFSIDAHKLFWSTRVKGIGGELSDGVRVPKTIKKIRDIIAKPQHQISYDKLVLDLKNMLREEKGMQGFKFFANKKVFRSDEVNQLIENCEVLESIAFNITSINPHAV